MTGLKPSQSRKNASVPFSKWKARAGLAALALAAYAGSFGLGLAQDSKVIVAQDSRIREVTAENIKLILTRNYWWPKTGDGLYRPVTTLSLLFNSAVLGNGTNPAGYHAVNFLLHAINVWLVFELALLLFRTVRPALFAAALWAVHPICTEAVTSIVGRADLLAAMAVLGGLLLYARTAWFAGRRLYWAAAALFAIATAGVFSKESAAVLLGLMLLWDLSFAEGKPRLLARWPAYAAVAASLVVLAWARHAVLGPLPAPQPVYVDNPILGAGFFTARLTAIKVIGLDLWLLLFPLGLSCDRSYNQVPLSTWSDPWGWIALLVVIAILALAFVRYRRDRLTFWLAGFFAIALLPTANLLFPIGALMAERFLYLPSVAFAIALAALLGRLKSPRHTVAVVTILAVLYAGRTFARNAAWNNDLTLASTDVQTTPESFRLHDMLAKALFEQDARRNIDRSIQEEEKSWQILSPLPPARSSEFPPTFLGIYYAAKADLDPANSRGWYEKSLAVLEKAREISQAAEKAYDDIQRARGAAPTERVGFQQLYFNLANACLNLGRYQEAIDALRYGRGLNPAALDAYDGLQVAYAATGNFRLAAVSLEEKAQVDGFQPATVAAIRGVYEKIPDGSCAFVRQGANWQLNMSCPVVKSDLCAAWEDLAGAYADARQPAPSKALRDIAVSRYGCASGVTDDKNRSSVPPK
jgi:tetratricopeptide (TPR) repeat protein